jgi:nitrous oxide reductase accessory protein NosL
MPEFRREGPVRLLVAVAAGLVAFGCTAVQPLAIRTGDRCFNCGRPIENVRLAGEIIDKEGHALKFRTAGCMARYMAQHPDEQADYRAVFVTDYPNGRFIEASSATYVKMPLEPGSMDRDYVAFASANAAAADAKKENTGAIDWPQVLVASKSVD